MNREDITRMAREAGMTVCRDEWVFGEMLERFAALVAAAEQPAQPQQKPVAVTRMEDGYIKIDYLADPFPVGPLYAAPLQAQPEQEPVAWKDKTYGNLHHQDFGNSIPLYTSPPASKPLTDEEIEELCWTEMDRRLLSFARAIEAAHGIWPENSDCHGSDWTNRDGEYLK